MLCKIEYTVTSRKKNLVVFFFFFYRFLFCYVTKFVFFFFISFFFLFVAHVNPNIAQYSLNQLTSQNEIHNPNLQLFILLCAYTDMVLSTLVYIALIIIVIIIIVVLLRFLFNAILILPVTLEHDLVVRYATTILPT